MGWRIPHFVWEMRAIGPTHFDRDFPVVKRVVEWSGSRFTFGWGCRCAGVAVVFHGGRQAELYGRACNLDIFQEFWPTDVTDENKLLNSLAVTEHWIDVNGMGSYASDRVLGQYAEWDRKRIALTRVQHRVCGDHPDLRNWSPPPGSPEVVLLPSTPGGLRLAGCVWTRETYQTRDGRLFLDI